MSPSAHYMMGGVWTDLNGATTVPGLFAAGEVTCSGVHGANRLASNSLLEDLVFGARAATAAVAYAGREEIPSLATHEAALKHEQYGSLDDVEKLRSSLRRTMWGQVGVIRSGESLIPGMRALSAGATGCTAVLSADGAGGQKHGAGCAVYCGAALWRKTAWGPITGRTFLRPSDRDGNNTVGCRSARGISGTPPRKSRGLLLRVEGVPADGTLGDDSVANEEGP